MKIPLDFYIRHDVVQIGRELLGKVLCTNLHDQVTKAVITETEAYAGVVDKASHAYGGRRTKRSEPMYARGGTAYVYLCYGIHHLFNVVTNEIGTPHAILIRAGTALEGIDVMERRRNKPATDRNFLNGPGSLGQALGITTDYSGVSLLEERIWIENRQVSVDPGKILSGPRVGIDYAEEDAKKPYRFRIGVNDFSLPEFDKRHHVAASSAT